LERLPLHLTEETADSIRTIRTRIAEDLALIRTQGHQGAVHNRLEPPALLKHPSPKKMDQTKVSRP
jgi:hypothetical protein